MRPDNYEITYIMHNQQPWVSRSDKPCLVTYNPISEIDREKIIGRWWFQHIVHDIRHVALLIHLFRFIQGQTPDLALRSSHAGQQPGDVFSLADSRRQSRWVRIIRSKTPRRGGPSTTTGASCLGGDSRKPGAENRIPTVGSGRPSHRIRGARTTRVAPHRIVEERTPMRSQLRG